MLSEFFIARLCYVPRVHDRKAPITIGRSASNYVRAHLLGEDPPTTKGRVPKPALTRIPLPPFSFSSITSQLPSPQNLIVNFDYVCQAFGPQAPFQSSCQGYIKYWWNQENPGNPFVNQQTGKPLDLNLDNILQGIWNQLYLPSMSGNDMAVSLQIYLASNNLLPDINAAQSVLDHFGGAAGTGFGGGSIGNPCGMPWANAPIAYFFACIY